MSNDPTFKDNWYRFGDVDSNGDKIVMDTDVDDVDSDIFDDPYED